MENKKKNLVKNTLIIGLGRLLPQAIAFLLIPLYTAFLSPAEFGIVDLVMGITALMVPLVTLQLEFSAFRYLIDSRGDLHKSGRVVTSSLVTVIGMVAVLSSIYLIVGQFISIPYFYIILLSILFTILSNFLSQIARGLGENAKYAQSSIVMALVTIAANILFIVVLGLGAEGMLIAIAIGAAVNCIFLSISINLGRYFKRSLFDADVSKELLKYSLPLVPGGIAWWVISTADRLLIAAILGVASNGIYAIAYKFPLILNSFFAIFNMSWTESAALHINSKDRNKFFSEVFNLTIKLFGSLAILIVAFVPLIFDILVNGEFREAYLYIPIMILGAFMSSMLSLYTSIYFAKKMTKDILSTVIVAALVSISLNALLLPLIGLYAAAISTLVAFGGMVIYRHYHLKKYVDIVYSRRNILLLVMLFVFTSVLYYLNNWIGNYINVAIVLMCTIIFNKTTLHTVGLKLLSKVTSRKA